MLFHTVKLLFEYTAPTRSASVACCIINDYVIATAHSDGMVHMWKTGHPEPTHAYRAHETSCTSLVYHGNSIISGGQDGHVMMFDAVKNTVQRILNFKSPVTQLLLYKHTLLVCLRGKPIRPIDLTSNALQPKIMVVTTDEMCKFILVTGLHIRVHCLVMFCHV